MFVVLSISLLLLTLMIIGVVSLTILRKTYYDLERRRKMMENKKARSTVATTSIRTETKEVGKMEPTKLYPKPSMGLDNPTYGILNKGYETTKTTQNMNVKITLKEVDDKQLSTILKETEDKNSETEEYDHLDYNRSIYINDLSENYCSGTPSSGIQQAPENNSLFGEVCSGTHV